MCERDIGCKICLVIYIRCGLFGGNVTRAQKVEWACDDVIMNLVCLYRYVTCVGMKYTYGSKRIVTVSKIGLLDDNDRSRSIHA